MRFEKTLTVLASLLLQQQEARKHESDRDLSAEFIAWAASANKHYASRAEFNFRRNNWIKSNAVIDKLNEMYEGATFAHNFTSDLTEVEYAAMLSGAIDIDQSDKIDEEPSDTMRDDDGSRRL